MKKLISLLLLLFLLIPPVSAESALPDAFNWYEIFVRSYQDSDGDGIGDFNGVLSRLDCIADMGYNGIWFMPIMPSPSYHKYDVTDYKAVDPQYGTMDDFRALVQACHEKGIRVIIDLPVNHTSTRHPWFLAAVESIQKRRYDSPYLDYYCFTEAPAGNKYVKVSGSSWHYEEQFAGGNMPDLNLSNEAVLAELRDIVDFWLTDVDVDGFRLDAVTSFHAADIQQNVATLDNIKAMCEAAKPGAYLVGEAWVGQSALADYWQSTVDSFFLFPASQAEGFIVKSILGRSPDATKYVKGLETALELLPEGRVLAPFLCNHDTGRSIGLLQARKLPERAKFAQGLLGMMPGNVFTYYGDEIGMVGAGDDPNKRLAMYWNDGDMTQQPPGVTKLEYAYPCADDQLADPASLLNYCRAVNHARLASSLIARGVNTTLYSDKSVVLMKRELNGDCCYIAINFAKAAENTVEIPATGLTIISDLVALAGNASLAEGNGVTTVTIPAYGIVVIE
ncbi:MAG: alpha-amylase [Clostridia bacterium]|nr:alpha-amylase [Clostridia bacterium]